MIRRIYVERRIADHPRARQILGRFRRATVVPCERYGEVFNTAGQSFRLQKRQPALILARKHRGHVLETPPGYGVGGDRNYYFSHMLNCPYDCRYCFLQGMYRSASYVVFVDFEATQEAIAARLGELAPGEEAHFFSGYDCDSLAFEGLTGFAASFVPFFAGLDGAVMELRTKSAAVKPLLDLPPTDRCVVAYSLTPGEAAAALEHGAPPVERRVEAARRLALAGWQIGLRFDPLIYHGDFRGQYRRLFDQVFAAVPAAAIHSVSFGPFRLPAPFFKRLERAYPEEPLLAGPLERRDGVVTYRRELEAGMRDFVAAELVGRVGDVRLFGVS